MNLDDKPEAGKLKIPTVVLFYSIMVGIGIVWNSFIEKQDRFIAPSNDLHDTIVSVVSGTIVAAIIIGITAVLEKHVKSLHDLSDKLTSMMSEVTITEAAVFSISSAIGEEFLFRGAMMPSFGIIATSLIFGFSHGMFQKPYIAWGVFAIIVGFALGLLTIYTGNVIAAVICHFTINYFNFLDIAKEKQKVHSHKT